MSDTPQSPVDPRPPGNARSEERSAAWWLRAAIAVAVGVVTFVVIQAAQGFGAPKAEVIMVLDGSVVSWPYHDAVREAGAGRVVSDPAVGELARELAGPGATVDSVLLNGPSHFSFSVTAEDEEQAKAAADAIGMWLTDTNLADQRQPLVDELAVLAENTEELEAELAATDSADSDDAAANAEPDPVASARYLEQASLLAEYERRADTVETDLALVRPQYSPAGPAEVPDRLLTPLLTALGAALAALAAFFVYEPR